eukprot:GFUD01015925.1.p1 GENE.GFUD01015925.1~~GFUD01015925.1.p1  ORF type:complete len:148 (-),score=45.61 GFUD01015925.1:100-543(-)
MHKSWLLCLFCCVQLVRVSHCQMLGTEENEEECKGSVTLYEGSEETVVTKDEDVRVDVDRVKVEGCGCFTLHSRKEGRGRSYFLGRRGEFSAADIGWSKVRSVRKAGCDSRAMPLWAVILIVVGLVVLIAVMAVFGFRKYRQYAASV